MDFLRGFSIVIAVIFIHTSADFLSQDWVWINALYFPFADFVGPLFFVFISAISIVFSVKQKEGEIPDEVIRNRIIARGGFIMMIGGIINVFHNILYPISIYSPIPFPLSVWGWNILFFIGFSQIAAYFSYKCGIKVSAILGILILVIGVPLREFIFFYNLELIDQNSFNIFTFLIHFIITSPIPQIPLIPCIAVTFISTIFGQLIYSKMEKGEIRNLFRLLKIFLILSIGILIFSVLFGLNILAPGPFISKVYSEVNLIKTINAQTFFPSFSLIGFPAFLIRGSISHTTFAIGFSLLAFTICVYYLDLKKRQHLIFKFFNFYGKYSLSFFLFVFYFDFAFHRFLNIYLYMIYYIGVTSLLGLIIYLWKKYSKKAFLSPEWIVGKICFVTANITYKRLNKKDHKDNDISHIK